MDNAKLHGICKVCGGTISRHINTAHSQDHKYEESSYRYNPQGKLVEIVRE
jgi:YD repeat-containing protein